MRQGYSPTSLILSEASIAMLDGGLSLTQIVNLDSNLDWDEEIAETSKIIPNSLSVLGQTFKIRKPYAIYLVKRETMDELCGLLFDQNGYFLKYDDLRCLSGKSETEIHQALRSLGERELLSGQPGLAGWFVPSMMEWIISRFGLIVPMGDPYVVLSPEAISSRSQYVEDFLKRVVGMKIDPAQIRDRTVKCVLWHELGHICFERLSGQYEHRLSEGLANFFAFLPMDHLGREVLHTLACSSDMDFRRNYYHLMRFYGGATDSIISSYLGGNKGEAFRVFEDLRRHAEAYNAVESNGGKLRIGGNITGEAWIAYGASRYTLATASKLPYLCNIKSGIVIAEKIGRIIGFLNEDLKVITNGIDHHEYPQLPSNVKEVSEAELDIARTVREDLIPGKISEAEILKSYF